MAAFPDETEAARLQRAYLEAVYRCRVGGRWLPLRIGESAPAIDAALPGIACFGLLSAWNPGSRPLAEPENRSADARLARALRAAGWRALPGSAAAADGVWREPGWLIAGIGQAALDALALRFGQLGALHWRRGGRVGMRMYRERPESLDLHPCVEWIQCAGPPAPAVAPDSRRPPPGRE
ncbi:DUF3293 domain-containing protein [Luteimonas sp. RD2P54]|uniref:DUF3293 domain-containing protein n=1 Tax=Luteimonas endophytica TaxID=3042023 RepID=A0ABT6J4G1_9GAMM|nr:DUF3293 domain-containing protein [Luteimonas endophytica]MDH5821659.1 DUF3293 domain-containing protein [Luteimonas endophytica]